MEVITVFYQEVSQEIFVLYTLVSCETPH
jgi:hypothetical protein